MDINSILCIGRDELMERKKHVSHDFTRRVSSGQSYYKHDGRPNSVVEIYSPSNLERRGARYRLEKERSDVVSYRRPDSRQKTYSTGTHVYDLLRQRSRGNIRTDPRRELVQSARERLLSNVTDVNFLLCRGYTQSHKFDYGSKVIPGKTDFDIKKDKGNTQSVSVHSSQPVRITSSRRSRNTQQEVPKVKYVTEIVQPCSVIVSPRKQEQQAEEVVQEVSENRTCILRSKSAPPGNGCKSVKRVSFGPQSIFGESTA